MPCPGSTCAQSTCGRSPAPSARRSAASTSASRSTTRPSSRSAPALLDHLVRLLPRPADRRRAARGVRAALRPAAACSPLTTRYQDTPTVTVLDQVSPKGEGADEWHSDNTFMAKPPMGSILRAVQLPAVGGDTCFASMYAAYDASVGARARARRRPDCRPRHHEADAQGDRGGPHEPRPRRDAAAVAAGGAPGRRSHIPRPGARRCSSTATRRRTSAALTERENDVLLPFLLDHVVLARLPVPLPLGGRLDRVLGQPQRAALRVADYGERRVMHRVTIDGPFR